MLRRAAIAGAVYAALLVGAGTVIGVLRTLVLAPALGEAVALALELPVMIVLAWYLSGLCVTRAAVPLTRRALTVTAGTALATLAVAEIALAAALHPDGVPGWLRGLASATGLAGLLAQLLCALLPLKGLVVSRRGAPARLSWLPGVAVAVAFGAGLVHAAMSAAGIGGSFVAKTICSGVFVSGRPLEDLTAEAFALSPLVSARTTRLDVDKSQGMVRARVLGVPGRTAWHRPGYGCALVADSERDALPPLPSRRASAAPVVELTRGPVPGLDEAALQATVAEAFAGGTTHAVVVVVDDRIVAERYAPGIDRDTPLPGWSAAKSIFNALTGILVASGTLDLDEAGLFERWSGDRRREVTVAQLLRMTSGIDFDEDYANPWSDAMRMLFRSDSAADAALTHPLRHAPGTSFSYTGASTNLLSRLIRDRIGDDQAYHRFPYEALFTPIGMQVAVLETDAAGTFVGSSFALASARGWARLGLLYLHDGVWAGRRILPRGWVRASTREGPAQSGAGYGAHFWLRVPDSLHGSGQTQIAAADAYHAAGFDGQLVTVVPSRRLVLVRLGLSRGDAGWDHVGFTNAVLAALPAPGQAR